MLENISTETLLTGNLYFRVFYHDNDLLVPEITSCFYIGQNIFIEDGADDDRWYFQNAESYLADGIFRAKSKRKLKGFVVVGTDSLSMMYDYYCLSEELRELSSRGQ